MTINSSPSLCSSSTYLHSGGEGGDGLRDVEKETRHRERWEGGRINPEKPRNKSNGQSERQEGVTRRAGAPENLIAMEF